MLSKILENELHALKVGISEGVNQSTGCGVSTGTHFQNGIAQKWLKQYP